MVAVAVIGAGVVGLSSAYSLKLFDEDLDVTVYAATFSPHTTSDGAAGIFKFTQPGMRDTPQECLRKWANCSRDWFEENWKKSSAAEMGISLVSGYLLSDKESLADSDLWLSTVYHQLLDAKQLEEFGPEIRSGAFAKSYICECRKYLPWLLNRFKEKGGKVVQKKISSFEELSSYEIIVNCSGLGAVELCHDKEMQPYRGQVARIKAPWVKHWYHIVYSKSVPPHLAYIYPNTDNIVIGGTNEISWDLSSSGKTRRQIIERAQRLIPSLKHAEFVEDWVGLRPSRSSIRLEREDVALRANPGESSKTVKVVHNYGHGPSGVSFSWGCAQQAVELVEECIKEVTSKRISCKL